MNNLVKTHLMTGLLLLLFATLLLAQPVVYENAVDFETAEIATLVGADGIIMKTFDGGVTWEEQTSGVTNVLNGNDAIDGTKQIVVGENGVILITTDGGTSWDPKASNTLEHLNDVCAIDALNYIIVGNSGTVLKSTDGGESYMNINSGTINNLNDVCFVDEFTGYIVGNSGTLLKTADGGESWTAVNTGLGPINLSSTSFSSATDGTVVGENGFIATTRDGGLTWYDNIGLSFIGDFKDLKFFDPNTGMAVGTDGLMARTTDGGFTWIGTNSTIGNDLMAVNFGNESNGISVGEDGIEIFTQDGGKTWRTSLLFAEPLISIKEGEAYTVRLRQRVKSTGNQVMINNYPNPFNPTTNIKFVLPFNASVTIKIYDITGREVQTLINEFRSAGSYEIEFNGSGLASGVYFYEMAAYGNTESIFQINKMVLTK